MGLTKEKRQEIIDFIIKNVPEHPTDIVRLTSEKFCISRQAVHNYLNILISEKTIETSGQGRNKTYFLARKQHHFRINLTLDINEGTIWRENVLPVLPELRDNVLSICQYGITEMVNNVIDHSGSKDMILQVKESPIGLTFFIIDHGIGVFNKIYNECQLEHKRFAILELAKGKLTTDPDRHTGEGIFFTSRMFDSFHIFSDDLVFSSKEGTDILFEGRRPKKGTAVVMEISKNSRKTIQRVFDAYTPDKPEDYGFKKTIVPVKLLQIEGEQLISRSQAKRLTARFEKFSEVLLDFKGIKFIGQPFADEVFRVFAKAHPAVHLIAINTNKEIEKSIAHVTSSG